MEEAVSQLLLIRLDTGTNPGDSCGVCASEIQETPSLLKVTFSEGHH